MMYEKPWKITTKPRGAPWWPSMYVHSDTEVHHSKHDACGSPVRQQSLSSQPPVTTDETAYATATGYATPTYCPKCNVLVDLLVHMYSTSEKP